MAAARQQLALEQREQRVRDADQGAGRDRAGEGELAGVAVAVAPHGDEQGGQDDEHRLLGEHGRGGGDARAEVVPQVAAGRGGQAERQQRPHHREVVEEDLALQDDRQRREPEERHGQARGPAGQRQAPREHVEQDRTGGGDQQHRDPHRADGHRLGADQRGDPGEQGDLDPAQRRVVVPVGVVGQALALLHGPGLGEVGALVVAEGRVVGDVPALDGDDRHEQQPAEHLVGAGRAEPRRSRPAAGTVRAGRGCLRGGRGGGRRGKCGGHAGTSSRVTSVRCAPTCEVSSQSLRPRCSRHTARIAAPARSTW